jgi:glucose/arabinose dehydrogenase
MPGPAHNGGALEFDKYKNLLITIGDLKPTLFNENRSAFDTKVQNFINGTSPDGRAGILRVTKNGAAIGQGILGDKYPLNLYYAYGIRNSFGIDFDPLTGNLWDTENGPHNGDEINLVKPGFNSGWEKVQGVWKINKTREKDGRFNHTDSDIKFVNFNGNGKYSRPEFVWDTTIGPTALTFLNSDKLGTEYENDIFVGSTKKGRFHFELTENRESLALPFNDYVLNNNENPNKFIFGKNFGTITDLEVGPDGFLYVLSGFRTADQGSIYRIVPK